VTNVAFVTPVHGRPEITRLAMEQRKHVCGELRKKGITATAVYVGDDQNMGAARELGFHTVRRENRFLGRKFNDGFEYACRELEASYCVPIGSDDWVLADYIAEGVLGTPPTCVGSGQWLTLVRPDGGEIAMLEHRGGQTINARGYIPWVIPTQYLEACRYRPAAETRTRGLDADIAVGVQRSNPRPMFAPIGEHPLQCVDFKSPDTQITSYAKTVKWNRRQTLSPRVWETLTEVYPTELVEKMEKVYGQRRQH
jgi:hypothetical protein